MSGSFDGVGDAAVGVAGGTGSDRQRAHLLGNVRVYANSGVRAGEPDVASMRTRVSAQGLDVRGDVRDGSVASM